MEGHLQVVGNGVWTQGEGLEEETGHGYEFEGVLVVPRGGAGAPRVQLRKRYTVDWGDGSFRFVGFEALDGVSHPNPNHNPNCL